MSRELKAESREPVLESREPRAENREPLWRRYLRFFGPQSVADLDDEIRFHVEMRVRDYMARGMTEAEARQATAQRLGDMATARATAATIAAKKDTRMRRAQILDALTQDVSFALRTLGRQKAWTAVAVLTLSLGIGVSSGMFSVLNHLLLHPLSYPNAGRVAVVYQLPSQGSNMGMNVTMIPPGRVVSAWREDAKSFEAIEPYTTTQTLLDRPGDEPQSVATARVLPTFPAFTGERPLRGRVFTAQEARDGANVVLISERMWRSRFGAQDSVIGQTFVAFDKTQTVIGVMPES
ncbi:MAG TPA: ABC transporter permease, partial [Gemmatimonadaceae bacterium]